MRTVGKSIAAAIAFGAFLRTQRGFLGATPEALEALAGVEAGLVVQLEGMVAPITTCKRRDVVSLVDALKEIRFLSVQDADYAYRLIDTFRPTQPKARVLRFTGSMHSVRLSRHSTHGVRFARRGGRQLMIRM